MNSSYWWAALVFGVSLQVAGAAVGVVVARVRKQRDVD